MAAGYTTDKIALVVGEDGGKNFFFQNVVASPGILEIF